MQLYGALSNTKTEKKKHPEKNSYIFSKKYHPKQIPYTFLKNFVL